MRVILAHVPPHAAHNLSLRGGQEYKRRHDPPLMRPAESPVVVRFRAPMTPKQQQWLRSTTAHVRRIRFHSGDDASAALLHDIFTLVGGEGQSLTCTTAVHGQSAVGVLVRDACSSAKGGVLPTCRSHSCTR